MYLLTRMEDNFKIVTSIQNNNEKKERLNFYYDSLNCRMIDIVNLTKDVVIICDDEGLLVPNNPIFSILTQEGRDQQIAGNFLLAKNKMTDNGMDTVPFQSLGEIERLCKAFKIKVIGVTR